MSGGSRVRVLIVDDTLVVRHLVTETLRGVAGLEVVGTAPNGVAGVARAVELEPDVIVLDVEMPQMDGIETLRELRRRGCPAAVVMFSTLTERGARVTLEALELGAADYVTKPSNTGSREASLEVIRAELAPRLLALGARVRRRNGRGDVPAVPLLPRPRATVATVPEIASRLSVRADVEAVVIAVSTGGPNALAELLPALPGDLEVPVLVVQHMPPMFTAMLAQRLDGRCALAVREAAGGERLEPGAVWIAPGDHHLTVAGIGLVSRAELNVDPPEQSVRPAADVLFRSAARRWGPGVLAVVLTGMGYDGLAGSRAVVEAGGRVIAQDEDSSVVWGMPGAVATAGLTDEVLPLSQVASAITARVRARRALTTGARG